MSYTKKQKTNASTELAKGIQQHPEGCPRIDHWQSLSDEMVLFIFTMLPQEDLVKVSRINRRFRDLSRDASLWTELTLDCNDIGLNTDRCRKLVDRCKKLTSLKITNKGRWEKLNIMSVVMRAKQSLKSLEVVYSKKVWTWTPSAMKKLGSLEHLTRLTLSFNSKLYAVNSYAGAKLLEELANLDHLESLTLWLQNNRSIFNIGTRKRCDAAMKKVFQKLKKLKEVEISPAPYDESLVVALAKNNPDLRVLRRVNYSSLSNKAIDALANSCPALEEITIDSYPSESSIIKLSSSWPNLKRLKVEPSPACGMYWLNEKLIRYVEKLRSLESLIFDGYCANFTEDGIKRMLGSSEKLKHLSFKGPDVTLDLVNSLRIEFPDIDLMMRNY